MHSSYSVVSLASTSINIVIVRCFTVTAVLDVHTRDPGIPTYGRKSVHPRIPFTKLWKPSDHCASSNCIRTVTRVNEHGALQRILYHPLHENPNLSAIFCHIVRGGS